MDDRTDTELVDMARGGSSPAADVLFARHWRAVWQAAYVVVGERGAADDVAQAAVERAFRSLASFDRSRPFRPWLRRIVVNQALNHVRAHRREVAVAEPLEGASADPYAEVVERDELFAAVRSLDPDRRLVVALRYWLDLDPSEIASLLKIPVGTVSSRLARALAELRHHLEVTRQ